MNIQMVNSSEVDGGAAKFVSKLSERLSKNNFKIMLWVKNKVSLLGKVEELRQKNEMWQVLSKWLRRSDIEFFLSDLTHNLTANDVSGFNNKKIINNIFNKDIVHLHNLHGQFFNLQNLVTLGSKKIVWTLHDMWAITGHCAHSFECTRWQNGCGSCPHLDVYQKLWWDNSSGLWKSKKAIFDQTKIDIVCPSKWLMGKVKKSILANQKIHYIPNGVDEMIFKNTDKNKYRAELDLPLNKKIILFQAQGGLENVWKGGKFYKEIMIRYQDNPDYYWLVIGGDQNLDEKHCRYVKYFNDEKLMARYFASADVFLYPTLADNCPLVVLEAMSSGTPVVTFKTGGVPELVGHLETGYVAKYQDIQDLNSGLMMVLTKDQLRKRMAVNSRLKVMKKFTLNKMTGAYIDLYKKC